MAELRCLHAYCERLADAEALQAELVARSRASYVQGSALSLIPAWLGRLDQAIEHCEKGIEERDGVMIAVTSWPMVGPIWKHPRYPERLKCLGLSEDPNRVEPVSARA